MSAGRHGAVGETGPYLGETSPGPMYILEKTLLLGRLGGDVEF